MLGDAGIPTSSTILPSGEYRMRHDKNRLGVGIRGAGQVAYEHAKAIENNPHLYFAAVCSRTEESAQKLAAQYNPEAKVYRHYEDMLADAAVDIVRYLSGKEVEEVFAYRCKKRPDFDYDTTLVASIKFRDGSIGKLSASLDGLCFPYQFNIDLLVTEGAIRDNRIYSKILFPEQTDFITLSSDTPNSGAVDHHPFQQEIDNLTDHILHDAPILSDVADACNSMEIVLAIEESAATGKPIKIKSA